MQIIQQSAKEMVDNLKDIVWSINPREDSLEQLIRKIEEFALEMTSCNNMELKLVIPEVIPTANFTMESRRSIYMFCKEAINNACKYSNASLLDFTVKEVDGKLEFSICDNGKGFDAIMVRRGNGLENMQKRADEIGAKLILQSKQNEGSKLSMQIKIT